MDYFKWMRAKRTPVIVVRTHDYYGPDRREMDMHGNGRIIQMVLWAIGLIFLTGIAYNRLNTAERRIDLLESTDKSRAEILVRLETKVDSIKESVDRMEKRQFSSRK